MLPISRVGGCFLTLVLLGLIFPVHAADVEKLLPEDSEIVIGLNVRQVVDSGLVQKYALEKIKALLQEQSDVQKILNNFAINPLTDLDNIVLASMGDKNSDKQLIVVRGRFDVSRIEMKAEEVTKKLGVTLNAAKIGMHKIYQLTIPPNASKSLFVAFANNTTILASPNKTYLADALDNAVSKRATEVKDKELRRLLAKVDPKQSLWLAIPNGSLKTLQIDNAAIKNSVDDIDAISGGITLADDVTIEIAVAKKSADGAKELVKTIDEGLNTFKFLWIGVPPLRELVSTIKVSASDSTVTIKSHITVEFIEKLSKNEK